MSPKKKKERKKRVVNSLKHFLNANALTVSLNNQLPVTIVAFVAHDYT